MPQPIPYARLTSFTDHEAAYPSDPPPGASLDAEYNALSTSIASILANLVKIQRDDGALKNAIVTLDSLSTDTILALGAGKSWIPKGAWAAVAYVVSDVVSSGTGTFVCAIAHTGTVFATDLAAGRWIRIFDSAGSTPPDGSVTTAKLVDGAVTTAKIGFTALDLAGSIRAVAGLAAGTATPGSLMHAKLAAGAVYSKVERTTEAQGAVGTQIIGVVATWTLEQAISSSSLQLRQDATVRVTFPSTGGVDVPGAVRAVTGAQPTTGTGASIFFVASIGYLNCYDYDLSLWRDLRLRGKDVYITANGVEAIKATPTGVDILLPLTQNGVPVGYLGLPQNQQNAAYTLALTDLDKHVYSENVAGQIITIPAVATVPWVVGDFVAIICDGTNSISVNPAATVTLRLAGTATLGNRTIAAGGVAGLLMVKPNRWFFIPGAGAS